MTTTNTDNELKIYVQHGMEGPIQVKVDSSDSIAHILNNKKQEELSIMYKNKLLLDPKESFQFYDIENESTLFVIKKRLNISIIDNHHHVLDIIKVSPHQTIKQLLQQSSVIGDKHHFMFNGILISEKSKSLYGLGIHDDVFIHIKDTMVIIHEKPQPQQPQQQQLKKKKKNRCAYIQCSDKICKMIGDCRYCQSSYCSRHRLPEAHTCINLTNCKRLSHERNSVKLLEERCVASKI